MEEINIDQLIIGAGIGGVYYTSRINNLFPCKKILMLDKLSNYGGLIHHL